MNGYIDILNAVGNRLNDGRFRLSQGVQLPDEQKADLVASRTYFSWKGLVLLSQHLFIAAKENATVDDLQRLFDSGFKYAKSVNRIPLFRGLQFGYMIIPCIATTHVTDQVRSYVNASPRKHWSLFEFPVVYDLNTRETHYFRGAALWGAFFFSDLRGVVEKYIGGGAYR